MAADTTYATCFFINEPFRQRGRKDSMLRNTHDCSSARSLHIARRMQPESLKKKVINIKVRADIPLKISEDLRHGRCRGGSTQPDFWKKDRKVSSSRLANVLGRTP